MNKYNEYLKSLDNDVIQDLIDVFCDTDRIKTLKDELTNELKCRMEASKLEIIETRKNNVGKYFYAKSNNGHEVYYKVLNYDEDVEKYRCSTVSVLEEDNKDTGVYSFTRWCNSDILVHCDIIENADEVDYFTYLSGTKKNGRVNYNIKDGVDDVCREINDIYRGILNNNSFDIAKKFFNNVIKTTNKFIENNEKEDF